MHLTGLIGIVVLVLLAWSMSENRRTFPWRIVLGGIALQFVLAVTLIRFPPVVAVFEWIAEGIAHVIGLADEGIAFLFGRELLDPSGPWGFVFAIKVLPVIIYFASLMSVLYHVGVMQRIVGALAWLLRRTLGVSGPEALAMAANVFVGQTEAPLCIKPYLDNMTRAGLMTVMVGGFATIAGSVLAGYVGFLSPAGDEAERAIWISRLLTASVMSAPAAFVMARVIVPEREAVDSGAVNMAGSTHAANLLDAAARGATDGLHLALNVGAMLIAFVALLALVNWPIEALGGWKPVAGFLHANGYESLDLQTILGWIFSPLAWCMGVPWQDAGFLGRLMGEKIIATEFLAYVSLANTINDPAGSPVTDRTAAIAAYALCGFANFGSIGIQIGGLSAIAPSRRPQFVSLAFKAMLGGAFASWMTASIAGLFL
ncbi:MAG: NupC/NupG family nucleoside CNT transporter [Phycisphaeraceae bacterium]|nr:MAG: NupC/NupG family nucleoside CNT transporter [Phycisphaeraceae bacterium]